jgi:hypothetical protein
MQHHAYYVEGPLSLFETYLTKLNPFFAQEFDKFGVDDARALTERAQLKNAEEATFFIAVGAITSEAQQALLKLFEEPQLGTTFVLLAPHGTIIPTLRSRMIEYPKLQATSSKNQTSLKFLKATPKERSTIIATLLKDDEGAREAVRELLNGLEVELHAALKKTKQRKDFLAALQDITRVRSYVNDRSPSLKMLLEHLALSIPTLK